MKEKIHKKIGRGQKPLICATDQFYLFAVAATVASLRAPQLKEQLLKLKMSKLGEKDEKSVFGRCPQG